MNSEFCLTKKDSENIMKNDWNENYKRKKNEMSVGKMSIMLYMIYNIIHK